jgi:hypothetical protein
MAPKCNSSGKEKSTASTNTSKQCKDPKTTSQNASKDKRKQSTSQNLNVNDTDTFPLKEQASSAATLNRDDLLSAENLALFKSIQQQLEKNKKEGQQADDTGT